MPNHLGIYSFAESLKYYLEQCYQADKAAASPSSNWPNMRFELLSSGKFSSATDPSDPSDKTVTLYLHRITINNHLRNRRTGPALGPLGIDLHFLLTVWDQEPRCELQVLGWAMRQLHYHAFLNAGSLAAGSNDAGWTQDDVVSLYPAELTTEELARIWEAARRGYRLSYPFIARVVRLGMDREPDGLPVVATRFDVQGTNEGARP